MLLARENEQREKIKMRNNIIEKEDISLQSFLKKYKQTIPIFFTINMHTSII